MPRRPKLPDGHGLYWHPKTGIIWTRFWTRGEECRRSCKTRDPGAAAIEARRLRLEAEEDPSVGRRQRGSGLLEDLAVDDIVEHKNRGASALYLDRLESKWAVVLRNLGDVLADLGRPPEARDIDYDVLRDYEGLRRRGVRVELERKGKKRTVWRDRPARGQTIVREFRCLKRALEMAKRRHVIRALPDPWPTVKRDPKDKRRSGKLWPPALVVKFLSQLHDDARDEVEVAVLTGLRLYELKRLEAGWVEPAPPGSDTPAILRLPDDATKGKDERTVGLPAAALAVIKRRVEDEPRRSKVFSQSNFKKHRKGVAKRLGWPAPPSMRDLRHTYATLALHGTSDPVAVMRALGHKDLKTTELYLSSTLNRITAAGAAVENALAQGQKPDHPHRITEGDAAAENAVSGGKDLERATRLELATLSLGIADSSSTWLQSLADTISEERQKTGSDVEQPDHQTGSPKRRRLRVA